MIRGNNVTTAIVGWAEPFRLWTRVQPSCLDWSRRNFRFFFVILVSFGGHYEPALAQEQTIPTVTVAAAATSIEEGETASFTLSRTAPLDAALTVRLELSASQMTAFRFDLGAKTATFAAGDATAAYSVSTLDNISFQEEADSPNPSQFVLLAVKASTDSSYAVGSADSAVIRVTDNDEVVEFSILVPDGGFRVPEGGGSVGLSISATTLTSGSPIDNLYAINVLTDVHGSAASGTDYGPISETIEYPSSGWSMIVVAGATRYTNTENVTLRVYDDAIAEGDETFDLLLERVIGRGRPPYGVKTAVVTILDDDTAGVTVSPTSISVAEGSTNTYTVVLTSQPPGYDEVFVTMSPPAGTDVSVDPTRLTFDLDNWDSAQTVTVTAADDDDAVVEAPVTIGHSASGGGYGSVSVDAVTVRIGETDTAGVLVSAAALTVTEGAMDTYTVKLTSAPTADVLIAVTPPTGGEVTVNPTALTFTATTWSTAQTVTVAAAQDMNHATNAPVTITHSATGGDYDMVSVPSVVVRIEEDDRQASVTADQATVQEGGEARFTVSLAGGSALAPVSVTYSVTGTATSGADYTAPTGRLAIGTGASSGTITIATTADGVLDAGETLIVTLTGVSTSKGMTSVTTTPATTTIVDSGMVTVSVGAASAPEGGSLSFPVTLSGAVGSDVKLGWSTTAGTATSDTDYTAVTAGALTIDARETSGVLTVSTTGDTLAEAGETLTVTITGLALPGGVSLGVAIATGTIQDDDLLTASVAAETVKVVEGLPASFTVTLTGGTSTADVVVTYSLGGTATEGRDYEAPAGRLTIGPGAGSAPIEIAAARPLSAVWATADGAAVAGKDYIPASGVLNFPAGTTEARFAVELIDDDVAEGEEEFAISLSEAQMTVDEAPIRGLIVDDDGLPVEVALTLDRERVSEGEGPIAVSVTASLSGGRWDRETVVEIEVAGGREAGAVDFAPVDRFEIRIPGGASSASARFTLTPENDRVDERDETIAVSGGSVLPVLPASLVLEDDDERSRSIALAVAPEVVSEGGGSAMVEVTASLDLSSRAVDTPIRIAVSDSGEPGAVDYRAVESFELTIPRGELSGSVSLTLTPENDRVDELHETIHLSGTSALPVAPASLVLEDDDETSEAILLTVAPEVVPEDAGPTVVTVTASLDRSARIVETPVRIAAVGSGLSGVVGFEPVGAFTLTIPTEEMSGSGTFVLMPANDMEEAHAETVEVSGEADLPVSPARLMLIDDDDASLASAWLSRFARTVASQTVETVEERLVGRSAAADHLTLAGYRILAGRGSHRQVGAGAGPGAPTFGGGAWFGGPQPGAPLQAGPLPVRAGSAGGGGRGFSLGRYRADRRWDLLARSSFSLSSSAGEDPGVDDARAGDWTAWGRGALTNFRGVDDDLSLRGDVVTGTVGVDYERGRYLAGLAVGFSRGEGGFGGGPEAEASLTSGHPYMRLQVGENLSLWGVLGYGRGDFVLTEENGMVKETDIALAMGAVGLRRDLVSSARGFGLGLKADVFLARIDSEPAPGLAAVGEDVNRARLALEASYDSRRRFADAESQDAVVLRGTLRRGPRAAGGGYGSVTVDGVVVTVTDNDGESVSVLTCVAFGSEFYAVQEGHSVAVGVVLSRQRPTEVVVPLAVEAAPRGRRPGRAEQRRARNAQRRCRLPSEGFEIVLRDAQMIAEQRSATATIIDDDAAPSAITLALDRERVSEGAGATTVVVTASLTGGVWAEPLLVEVAVAGGGLTEAVDYSAVREFGLTIPKDQLSGSVQFTLIPEDDRIDERDETKGSGRTPGRVSDSR